MIDASRYSHDAGDALAPASHLQLLELLVQITLGAGAQHAGIVDVVATADAAACATKKLSMLHRIDKQMNPRM
jgi:hypothetical protein